MKLKLILRRLGHKPKLLVVPASLIMFIFLLTLVSVTAQTKTPILADTFTLNDAVTSSASFVQVDSHLINVSRNATGFIRISFEASKLTGAADITDFFWRILFDDVEITNSTHALEVLEVVPVEMQESLGKIGIGTHNITLEHRVEVNSMSTRKISATFVTNQFPNGTQASAVNDTLNFTIDDIEVFAQATSFNFNKLFNDSVILVSYFGLMFSDSSSNFDIEVFGSINSEQSGVFGTGIESPDDNKFVSYTWVYENVPAGLNSVDIFARNVQNTKVGQFQGDIDIIELTRDNLQANLNTRKIGTFSTSSNTPVFIESMLINVSDNASIIIFVETTATKSGSGKDNFSMIIDVNGVFLGENRTMELEAAADIANFAFLEVPRFTPDMAGERNITLKALVHSATTVTFTNISFIAFEIIPLQFLTEIIVTVDNAPNVTLVSPADNNVTNSTSIIFEVNVSDDFNVVNASLFHNASGSFVLNSTQIVNTTSSTVFFNLTFNFNTSLVWNVQAADNASGLTFGINRSLTINQTFPPDTEAPVITLIFPANNTRNNTVPLNITFSITDNSPNDIICTLTNTTTTFDSGSFTQSTNSNLTLAEGFIALDQNFPNLELTCFDNTVPFNNSATLNLNFTLDTISPVIILISPANNARFNKDIVSEVRIQANCTDVPVFRFNITVENDTDRVFSFESLSPVNNVISIDETLSITNLGSGNYTINYTCADPHTGKIADYNIRKNLSDIAIRWVTPSRHEFKIRYLQNSLDISTFGSEKTLNEDKYRFWFNTNETETTARRTFIFEIISRSPVYYISDSKYDAHFITGNNWIDFELDDPKATYLVTQNIKGNWEIEITTTRTKLNFKSIGDLNVASISTTFEIFFLEQVEDLFQPNVCRNDTGSVLLLSLFFAIALFFIIVGIVQSIGFITFFGSILLMILAWFIAACIAIFAFILALISFVLIIYSVVIVPIGFRNRTFK